MTLDKLLELSEREGVRKFIEAEQRRIKPYTFEAEQSVQVKKDVKAWALKEGMWPRINRFRIVEEYAEELGWSQEGFTGLEMPHDS
jgi:hypothetical protein